MSIQTQADIGVVGMAVMGQNLALNIESRGYTVAVYNRTQSTLHEFVQRAGDKRLLPAPSLAALAASLSRPRKILLMVQAGAAVDRVIADLQPHLEPGDILIDGGNSYFVDTIRRAQQANEAKLRYIGTGVSGGEEGALHGPSIMPGGDRDAYAELEPILSAIAARVDGEPCCTYIGADGAGHYVKMVHNGIEYGDMQLISEAYAFMKLALGMSHAEMHATFAEWNRGELDSYLIEITTDILAKTDSETGRPLVEVILDQAGQKGTGKWTSQSALDLGVPAPTVAEAVFARFVSALKQERVAAAARLRGPQAAFSGDPQQFLEALRTGAVCLEDLLLRPGVRPDAGSGTGTGVGSRLRRHRHDLARRLHHPRQVPRQDQGGLRARAGPGQPPARPLLHRDRPRRPAPVARSGGHRRHHRHPGAGVVVGAELLRQLSLG